MSSIRFFPSKVPLGSSSFHFISLLFLWAARNGLRSCRSMKRDTGWNPIGRSRCSAFRGWGLGVELIGSLVLCWLWVSRGWLWAHQFGLPSFPQDYFSAFLWTQLDTSALWTQLYTCSVQKLPSISESQIQILRKESLWVSLGHMSIFSANQFMTEGLQHNINWEN